MKSAIFGQANPEFYLFAWIVFSAAVFGISMAYRKMTNNWATKVVKRVSDGTYWAPAGDTPFPFNGFNFVQAKHEELFRGGPSVWKKDLSGERWVTTNPGLFEMVK